MRPHPAFALPLLTLVGGLLMLAAGPALAQATPAPPGWQACTALATDDAGRLACFDRWARGQATAPAATATAAPAAASPAVAAKEPAPVVIKLTLQDGCKNEAHSRLSRFWELESDTDCGNFGLRGFRPLSLSAIQGSSINGQPTSAAPTNNATTAQPYNRHETRIQLSVRTKIAKDMLTGDHPRLKDSLWFAYTQQSYWQLFNPGLSRPFRNTDHEPEVIYAYPSEAKLPGGWQLRYTGVGLVHQSNGQTLPLSRSWNRTYLMAGLEKDKRFTLQGKVWRRVPENPANDDNPDISNFVGRAELTGMWNVNRDNTLGLTLRHSLRADTRGSVRLEWLSALGNEGAHANLSSLRLHTQIFSGYGDSLLDYNRRRTVLSIGLSLVDW